MRIGVTLHRVYPSQDALIYLADILYNVISFLTDAVYFSKRHPVYPTTPNSKHIDVLVDRRTPLSYDKAHLLHMTPHSPQS